MSLLRILRNLAVLAILTVGFLSLSPRPMAAQSTCRLLGAFCTTPGFRNAQCGSGLCGPYHRCCSKVWLWSACSTSAECCNGGLCIFGRCH